MLDSYCQFVHDSRKFSCMSVGYLDLEMGFSLTVVIKMNFSETEVSIIASANLYVFVFFKIISIQLNFTHHV